MNKLMLTVVFTQAALAACEGRSNGNQTSLEALDRGGADTTPVPSGGHSKAEARARLKTAPGTTLTGSAEFQQVARGVRVRLTLDHAPPGKHGVHVHEKGDCSDIAGKSMGAHLAPRGHQHGLPSDQRRHLGDLGNIVVGENQRGQLDVVAGEAKLVQDDPMSYLGRAIVVHADADSGQGSSGESGAPIACGIIERT